MSLLKRQNADPAFWAVTCYFNSANDFRRHYNYQTFAERLKKQNINLLTVELCRSEHEAGLDKTLSTKYVRVNHPDVIWSKEALLNIGFKHLPPECTKVVWLDADVLFENRKWAEVCSKLLDEYKTVQPFTHIVFLGDGEEMLDQIGEPGEIGFAKATMDGLDKGAYRTGYGFGARREVLEEIGGLYDACSAVSDVLIGCTFGSKTAAEVKMTQHPKSYLGALGRAFMEHSIPWQNRAFEVVRGSLGAPREKMVAYHMWHGEPQDYTKLNLKLGAAGYDPRVHTTHDDQGLLVWEKSTDAYKDIESIMKEHFATRAK